MIIEKYFFLIKIIIITLFMNTGIVFADGFILINRQLPVQPSISTPFPLEVKYHHVNVQINDHKAETFVDQEFYNPSSDRLEGYYLFPIPKGAAIKKFSMYINGKETEAELLSAEKARKIYEDIVRRELDPALLEYQGMDLLRARIFPIEAYSTKRVKISYYQILTKDNGTFEYLYPLNTEKFSSKPLREVSVNVEIKSENILKNIYCASHTTNIIHKTARHSIISYKEKNVKPEIDFKLYFNTDSSKIGLSLLTYREKEEDGYFFLNLSPGIETGKDEINEKDITFVLDVSGSMAGENLEQAKKALLFCVNSLNNGDRFQIVRFSTEAETLFKDLSDPNKNNISKARDFINHLKAAGGTNIEEALKLALSMNSFSSRLHMVVFMTDGKPTIGETDEIKLIENIKKTNKNNIRIFTFGIGYDINTHLLDKITGLTRAYRSYITPKEDIEIKISNFYKKVESPVLTDLTLSFSDNIKILKSHPMELPDLFNGSYLTVLGRYRGNGKTRIELQGKIKNSKPSLVYSAEFTEQETTNDFIPPLWAARHIGYLLDQIRLNGEDKELIDEITELARNHGIITPYTSYLILEDEKIRVSAGDIDLKEQTLGSIAPDQYFSQNNKKEYDSMTGKSGASGVRSSKEFQALNKASNLAETRQGKSRLHYKNKSGETQNMSEQVKNVQGRAMYNSGKYWIDSRIQKNKKNIIIKIQFAGAEYFNFLQKTPEASQFLSLGKNIKFILGDIEYEIFE